MSTETNWYENVEQGTFHEVEKGSDTERRLQRDQRQVVDPETGEDYYEAAYRKVSESKATSAPHKQPGYVASDEPVALPVVETVPQVAGADTERGLLVGEPGAEAQAAAEVEQGGAAPLGVKPSGSTAKKTAAQARADKDAAATPSA